MLYQLIGILKDMSSSKEACRFKRGYGGEMVATLTDFYAKNPNPVLSVAKDGIVLYSNEAGEPLLYEWGVKVGEKLPSSIGEIVQSVISRNNPEKL